MRNARTANRMADTRDMVVVHAALLRELRLAPGLVQSAPASDRRRIAQVADHLRFVLDLLDHHHAGEDRLLWPLLTHRLGPGEAQTQTMEAQHEQVAALIASSAALVARWRSTAGDHAANEQPAGDPAACLAATLHRLHAAVEEHLHDEETIALPLVEQHLTESEWQQVGNAAMASIPKPQLPLVVGMIAYTADPALIQLMLAPAPRLVQKLMPRIGAAVYTRYARRIHGTATP